MDSSVKMNVALVLLVSAAGAFAERSFLVDVFIQRRPHWLFHHRCNGVLIAPHWVLAPAQCVKSLDSRRRMEVILDVSGGSDGSVIHAPIAFIHELAQRIYNDVAVLYLKKYVYDMPFVKLPPQNATYSEPLTLHTRDREGNITTLDVPTLPLSKCKGFPRLRDTHICAGDNTTSTLKSQAGSALIIKDPNGESIIVGMLTAAQRKLAPAVYTRISSFSDWIGRAIQKGNLIGNNKLKLKIL